MINIMIISTVNTTTFQVVAYVAAADDMDELVQSVKQAIQQCCLQVCLLTANA